MDNFDPNQPAPHLPQQMVSTGFRDCPPGPVFGQGVMGHVHPSLAQQYPPQNAPAGFPAPRQTCPIASALLTACNEQSAVVQHFRTRATDSTLSPLTQQLARKVCDVLASVPSQISNIYWDYPTPEGSTARTLSAIRRKDLAVYMMLSEQVAFEAGDISNTDPGLYAVASDFQAYVDAFGIHLPKKLSQAVLPIAAQFAYLKPSAENIAYRSDSSVFREELKSRRINCGGTIGISTGLEKLDALTGGLHGLTIVGGAAAAGKTDLAISAMLGGLSADGGTYALYVSADLPPDRIRERIICNLGNVTDKELYAPVESDGVQTGFSRYEGICNRILVAKQDGNENVDINGLVRLRDQLASEPGCKRLLIIVDYFQNIRVEAASADSNEIDRCRLGELQRLMRPSLNRAHQEFPMILISEIRKKEGHKELMLEDLSGSSRLGYGADNVLLLQALDTDPEASNEVTSVPVEVKVVKARRGFTGSFVLSFKYRVHRFEEAPRSSVSPNRGSAIRSRRAAR